MGDLHDDQVKVLLYFKIYSKADCLSDRERKKITPKKSKLALNFEGQYYQYDAK